MSPDIICAGEGKLNIHNFDRSIMNYSNIFFDQKNKKKPKLYCALSYLVALKPSIGVYDLLRLYKLLMGNQFKML